MTTREINLGKKRVVTLPDGTKREIIVNSLPEKPKKNPKKPKKKN